jgi:hypothetical protein
MFLTQTTRGIIIYFLLMKKNCLSTHSTLPFLSRTKTCHTCGNSAEPASLLLFVQWLAKSNRQLGVDCACTKAINNLTYYGFPSRGTWQQYYSMPRRRLCTSGSLLASERCMHMQGPLEVLDWLCLLHAQCSLEWYCMRM